MFTSLHLLAKQATLMITITAEGDDQLRVTVTPMPFDGKAKANLPQPLSLVAAPSEFDADFATALSTWQAPKRSLLEQAQAAAGGAAPSARGPALPAPKSEAKSDGKNDKAARKPRGGKGGEDEKKVDAVPAAAAAAGEAAADADQVMEATVQSGADAAAGGDDTEGNVQDAAAPAGDAAAVAAEAAPDVSAADEPVDKFTLDLF